MERRSKERKEISLYNLKFESHLYLNFENIDASTDFLNGRNYEISQVKIEQECGICSLSLRGLSCHETGELFKLLLDKTMFDSAYELFYLIVTIVIEARLELIRKKFALKSIIEIFFVLSSLVISSNFLYCGERQTTRFSSLICSSVQRLQVKMRE